MIKWNMYKFFILSALVILSFSCLKHDKADYYPMSVGARWEYSGQMRLQSGEFFKVKSVGSIVDKEIINGKEYYKLVTTYEGSPGTPPQTVSYLRKTEEGIYLVTDDQKDKPELLSTPLPLKVGRTWELESYSSGVKGRYRVEGRETIYVLGKKYEDCFKVYLQQEKEGLRGERLDYVAPNVGVVKQLVTYGDASLEVNLERYTPGKAED